VQPQVTSLAPPPGHKSGILSPQAGFLRRFSLSVTTTCSRPAREPGETLIVLKGKSLLVVAVYAGRLERAHARRHGHPRGGR